MKKDNLTELAKLFKARESVTPPSITTGTVVSPLPNPKIRLNDVIVLEKEHLIFSSSLIDGYERRIKFEDEDAGVTASAGDPSHAHTISKIEVETKMQWIDTLVSGDEVILIPSMDGQLYYVVDKAVRFGAT